MPINVMSLVLTLIFIVSCHSRFDENVDTVARECGYDAAALQANPSWSLVKIRAPEKEGLDNAVSVFSVKAWLTAEQRFMEIPVNAQHCFRMDGPSDAIVSVAALGTNLRWTGRVSDFGTSRYQEIVLEPWKKPNIALNCPTQSNGRLEIPYTANAGKDLQGFHLKVTFSREAQNAITVVKEKPLSTALADFPGAFSFSIPDSGFYFVGYQLDSAFDHVEELNLCRIEVKREAPELIRDTQTESRTLLVHPNERLPIRGSTGSQLVYCATKVGAAAATPLCGRGETAVLPESGIWELKIHAVDDVENVSVEEIYSVEVDGAPPRIETKWSDPLLNRNISGPLLPQRIFQAHIQTSDDITPAETLRSQQMCQLQFVQADGRILPGDFAICLSDSCRGRTFSQALPCGSDLRFRLESLPRNARQETNGVLSLIVETQDEIGQRSRQELQTILSDSHWPQWKPVTLDASAPEIKPIVKIVETADGILWVATEDRIFRRGPAGFEAIALSHSTTGAWRIYDLLISRDQRLIIGTSQGLFAVQSLDLSVSTLPPLSGLDSQEAQTLGLTHDGQIMAANPMGFGTLDESRAQWNFRRFLNVGEREALGIFQNSSGQNFVFYNDRVVIERQDRIKAQRLPLGEYLSTIKDPDTHIQVEGSKVWLLGAFVMKSFDMDTGVWSEDQWPRMGFTDYTALISIRRDAQGHRWILSKTGVFALDGTQEWALFDRRQIHPQGDDKETLTAFHVASDGRIWVGSDRGLFVLESRGSSFLNIPFELAQSRQMVDFTLTDRGFSDGVHISDQSFPKIRAGLQRLRLDDSGLLWGAAEKSIVRLEGMRLLTVDTPARERVVDFTLSSQGLHSVYWYQPESVFFYSLPIFQLHTRDRPGSWGRPQSDKEIFGKELIAVESYTFLTRDGTTWLNAHQGMVSVRDHGIQQRSSKPGVLMKPNGFIETRDGSIFASDGDSAYSYRQGSWTPAATEFPFLPEQFAETKAGQLWILSRYASTESSQLAMQNADGSWRTLQPWETGSENNCIVQIGVNEDGELFVVGRLHSYGIWREGRWNITATPAWSSQPLNLAPFDPTVPQIPNILSLDKTINDKIRFLHYRGQLWITGYRRGVFVFDPNFAAARRQLTP